jgi:hypothetical protein
MGIDALTQPGVSRAAECVTRDGYVIVRNALRAIDVETARRRCVAELNRQALWFGGGTLIGQIAYVPPADLEIVAKLITNPAVIECARDLLGPGFRVLSIGGNVNLPGSRFQPAHADGNTNTDYLGVNLPLGDVTDVNGSLEVFAGTHHRPLTYAAFRRACRDNISRRTNTTSGDIIIRYLNLWHRGTPNRSPAPRFMLAVILGKSFLTRDPVPLSPALIEAIRHAGVHADVIPSARTTGTFSPSYFQRTPRGIAKEFLWRYAPAAYGALRYLE